MVIDTFSAWVIGSAIGGFIIGYLVRLTGEQPPNDSPDLDEHI